MNNLLLLLFSAVCFAQSATLTLSSCVPTIVKPGSSIAVCQLVLSGGNTASTGPAGLQGTIASSQPLGLPTITVAGTALAAAKTAFILNGTFIISGMNQTQIADGLVATVSIPIPSSVTCTGNSPCLTVSDVKTLGATPAGTALAVIPGPPLPISVFNACDVNGDGVISALDYSAQLNASLSGTGGDRNGDGATDIVDVQIIANAVNGKGCTATQ